MTIKDMIVLATGRFIKEGNARQGYQVNFFSNYDEGDTRLETLFDGLTSKEASDIVRNLTEARRIVTLVLETYEANIHAW